MLKSFSFFKKCDKYKNRKRKLNHFNQNNVRYTVFKNRRMANTIPIKRGDSLMKNHKLIGCIQSLDTKIETRYFYVNTELNEVKDVTLDLCKGIEAFNEKAKQIQSTGIYSMMIPYHYNNGMAEYSFGCGLSHYLQESIFKNLESVYTFDFPLSRCEMTMYTPLDVRNLLGLKSVFHPEIENELKERFGLSKTA